ADVPRSRASPPSAARRLSVAAFRSIVAGLAILFPSKGARPAPDAFRPPLPSGALRARTSHQRKLMRFIFALASMASFAGLAQAQFEGWEPGPATPGVAAVPAGWTSVNASVGGPGTNPNWQVRNDGQVFAAL